MPSEHGIDLLVIEETNVQSDEQLHTAGGIHGYDLTTATYRNSHGIETYVKSSIANATPSR